MGFNCHLGCSHHVLGPIKRDQPQGPVDQNKPTPKFRVSGHDLDFVLDKLMRIGLLIEDNRYFRAKPLKA
jgi:hypothetical protein